MWTGRADLVAGDREAGALPCGLFDRRSRLMILWMYQRGGTMATERANDLRAFKGFIEEKLLNGGADLTLDEVLVH
jgi:hypothetical protein